MKKKDEYTEIPSAINFLGTQELEILYRNNVLTKLETLYKNQNKAVTKLFEDIDSYIIALKVKTPYRPLKSIRVIYDHSNKVWLAQKIINGKISLHKRSRDKGVLLSAVRKYCDINDFELEE